MTITLKHKRNILNSSLIICILAYFVFNLVYETEGYEEKKEFWAALYYVCTIQAFVILSLIRNIKENRIDKRIRISFIVLQIIIFLNKLLLVICVPYNRLYYSLEPTLLGTIECVICVLVLIYIKNGMDR